MAKKKKGLLVFGTGSRLKIGKVSKKGRVSVMAGAKEVRGQYEAGKERYAKERVKHQKRMVATITSPKYRKVKARYTAAKTEAKRRARERVRYHALKFKARLPKKKGLYDRRF